MPDRETVKLVIGLLAFIAVGAFIFGASWALGVRAVGGVCCCG